MANGTSQTSFPSPVITRFAPSPTGLMHLGHVANAVYVWGIARALGGQVLLRLEDHDRGRFRPEYEHAILDDLEWMGLTPDAPTIDAFRVGSTRFRQSDSERDYQAAVRRLRERGLVYVCECTRADIAADIKVLPGQEAPYSGRCRARKLPDGAGRGLRVALPDETVRFEDVNLGSQHQDLHRQCGDMSIRDRAGNWTYQFCVTVDDLQQGVTTVIRGEDLLPSTGRQLALRSLIGGKRDLSFFHHPLIRDRDGRKLSKRDGDLGIARMRAAGMHPQEVLGRAAFLVGLSNSESPIEATELSDLFGNCKH